MKGQFIHIRVLKQEPMYSEDVVTMQFTHYLCEGEDVMINKVEMKELEIIEEATTPVIVGGACGIVCGGLACGGWCGGAACGGW